MWANDIKPEFSRRDLLGMGAGALISMCPISAMAGTVRGAHRSVTLRNVRTDEALKLVYWEGGRYVPESLREINHILRDFRTGETAPIKVRLVDLLYAMQRRIGTSKAINIVSGYRSPETNAMLRRSRRGVAKNSYHISGMAVDIKIPGYTTSQVAGLANSLNVGGVGYYPRSGFVHVDVGPVRSWRG